jgi:creatinine amidohydrolase/Fe(II)-dependent formamide hydrolase-like protein
MMHTFIPPHRFFPYLTWTEIQAMPNKENVVIIQPVASIEQHGPHLPLVVDACIGTAIIGRAMENWSRRSRLTFCPPSAMARPTSTGISRAPSPSRPRP